MEWNDRAKRGMTCGIEDARGSNIPVRHSHLGAGVRRSDHPQSVQNGRAEDHRIDREFGPPHPKAAALPHRVALLPLLPFLTQLSLYPTAYYSSYHSSASDSAALVLSPALLVSTIHIVSTLAPSIPSSTCIFHLITCTPHSLAHFFPVKTRVQNAHLRIFPL